MLSDVTMGQFFPGKSVMHRLDPRIKMCLTVYFIVLIFCSKNFVTLGATILMSLLGVVLSKVPLKLYLKSMKPILFIVVFTGVLNLFYGTGDPIFTLGFIHITRNGIVNSIMIAVRIVVLILISSILTFTTSPTQLTDAIERLLKPLALLHVPVHEFAMMMTIALRFVPTLLEETEKIMAGAEGPRCRYGKRRSDAAHQGADSGAYPAVCFCVPPCVRPCNSHGKPLLPRRRGAHENEGAAPFKSRLHHAYRVRFVPCGVHHSEHFAACRHCAIKLRRNYGTKPAAENSI